MHQKNFRFVRGLSKFTIYLSSQKFHLREFRDLNEERIFNSYSMNSSRIWLSAIYDESE
jgi:hypothetical protein